MYGRYFNYSTHIADGVWERRSFVRRVWRIYADDPRWTPPSHAMLLRALKPERYVHIDRASPTLLSLEALQRSRRSMTVSNAGSGAIGASGAILESPVAAVALLADPRRHDRTVYLGLLRFINDGEVVERLLGILMEELRRTGRRRIVGPTGLSPRLQSGVLHDAFDRTPPLGTPYNPPYMAELLDQTMQPLHHSRLYHATATEAAEQAEAGPATITPLHPARLAGELLPLFQQAFGREDNMPPVDEAEAIFLLDWIRAWPCESWVATVDGEAAGFLILQPDLSEPVRRANGGRNPLWLPWLWWRRRRPVQSGRLRYLAVGKQQRGNGIGRQLWNHALARARQLGWRTITAGPLFDGAPAAAFAERMGATPRQHYTTYYMEM